MKVLLYFENQDKIKKSGIGRALRHQIEACTRNNIEYTLDKNDSFDIAHINTYFFKSYRLAKKCKKKGIPLIVHAHSTKEDFLDSFRLFNLIKYFYYSRLKKLYSIADLLITPTEYSKNLILKYGWNYNIIALSNGIDLERYEYNENDINSFINHFNIKKDDKVIIGVGLPFKRKGLHDFFEVARRLPNYKFIWFGYLNPLFRSHFINKEIKHRPKNVIMPGYIDGSIILGAFHRADVVFFPTYEETEGIVSLEALASKAPLLVRDIGVYDGWLKNNESCFMGKNNDDFTNLIEYIISHDVSNVTSNGYEVAKSRGITLIGKELKLIYSSLLNNQKENE